MTTPIHSVAVIGAGISGVCTAAHLLKQGLNVTVYERGSVAGGVWHFDPRSAHEQAYPNETPSRGDYERVVFEDEDGYQTPPRTPPERELEGSSSGGNQNDSSFDSEATVSTRKNGKSIHDLNDISYTSIAHSSPGPCYVNLKNNVSLTAMKTSLADWPVGLEEFVNQRYLEGYIQLIARTHRVHEVTRYNTRVEDARKVGGKWRVCTTTLVGVEEQRQQARRSENGDDGILPPLSQPYLQKRISYHDALVVASGHYHMPRIPDIPGLREWKARFPDRISHSKGYRDATKYRGATVLIIGAGVSSVDIAKEIAAVGGTVYQSSRGGVFDLPATMLPQEAQRIGGVDAFRFDETSSGSDSSISSIDSNGAASDTTSPTPLPGYVLLTNGTALQNITHVILATGYITSLPFLPTYHADTTPRNHATPSILVTREGDMIHNLHRDIFYIEDPTLSFVGVPYHISTFSLFDFQAQVLARVYSSTSSVHLPSREQMRADYEERVRTKGLGREFHSLRPEGVEIGYVAGLVEWVNAGVRKREERMQGHNEIWLKAHWEQREMLRKRFAGEV